MNVEYGVIELMETVNLVGVAQTISVHPGADGGKLSPF
jgi:hypothetical protein